MSVEARYPGVNALHDFLSEVYSTYRQKMFTAAYYVLRRSDLAEDAVNQSLVHIARYPKIQDGILNRSQEDRGLYIALIAHGRALLMRRKAEPDWPSYDDAIMDQQSPLSLEDMVLLKEQVAEVGAFFLQGHSINALTLQLLWEGLDYHEIADEMQITEANARKRIQRGRAELLAYLHDRGEGG